MNYVHKLIYAIFMPTEPELYCVGMWSLSGKDGYTVSDHMAEGTNVIHMYIKVAWDHRNWDPVCVMTMVLY